MKINNIDFTTFNGIYRLPKTSANIKELEEQVLPIYNFVRKEKIYFFIGSNPFKSDLLATIKHVAQVNGASVDWLKINAKKYNVDINDLGDNIIHVITGNKDNERFNNFFVDRLCNKKGFFTKLAQKVEIKKLKANLPEHLQEIIEDLFYDQEEDKVFKAFADSVVDVKTPYEVLNKAFAEK